MGKKTLAVVVRCHNPTAASLGRIASWCKDVRGCVDVWISIDTSTQTPSRRREASKKRRRSGGGGAVESRGPARRVMESLEGDHGLSAGTDFFLHTYDEVDMVRAYPTLRNVAKRRRLVETSEFFQGSHSLAWGFHVEPLNLWFQRLGASRTYDFVWKFEDDVGLSGPLSAFLRTFDGDASSDLITSDVDHRPGAKWWWVDACSEAYEARYKRDNAKLATREHVQRFSRKLLDRLHVLNVRDECTAWSEALAVTVCHGEDDLVLTKLPKALLGDPYDHKGRVTERQWRDILSSKSDRRKNRLYHALKF